MSEDLKKVICAGAIVFRMKGGKVEFLLVKPSKGSGKEWGAAKGHTEPGEDISQCAVRETYEETGAVCRLIFELPPLFTKNPNEVKTVHLWLAKQLNPEVPLKPQREEIAACGWFPMEDLPPTHEYQKPAFDAARAVIKKNLS